MTKPDSINCTTNEEPSIVHTCESCIWLEEYLCCPHEYKEEHKDSTDCPRWTGIESVTLETLAFFDACRVDVVRSCENCIFGWNPNYCSKWYKKKHKNDTPCERWDAGISRLFIQRKAEQNEQK